MKEPFTAVEKYLSCWMVALFFFFQTVECFYFLPNGAFSFSSQCFTSQNGYLIVKRWRPEKQLHRNVSKKAHKHRRWLFSLGGMSKGTGGVEVQASEDFS